MDTILSVSGLCKEFSSVQALDNVSFSVQRGSIVGLLGPNGAGKTTLLRIINAILTADSGEVLLNDNPVSFDTSRHIGYMPEERGLYDKMRVADQILYFGALKGGDKKRMREVMSEYLALFNLQGQEHRQVRELSKGNQQKVQIIATLVHEPEFVILDEPFSGFDPINGAILQQLIHRLHAQGTTVMLSSHNMAAIEEMCDNIILINRGRMLVQDSIINLKEKNKDQRLLLTVEHALPLDEIRQNPIVSEIIPTPPQGHRLGNGYIISKADNVSNNDILKFIVEYGDVIQFEEKLPSLQEIFMRYVNTTSH